MRDFYGDLAPDARYWGDKNPHYADPFNRGSLELVAELFPGSRFVHIIRDGRDVVSSLSQKRWREGKPWATFDHALRAWKQHVRLGRGFGEALGPDWVRSYSMLLGMIQLPTILFWFSVRPPDYEESYTDVHGLFGEFPQLVNQDMIDESGISATTTSSASPPAASRNP
jgi:hypothetical protein